MGLKSPILSVRGQAIEKRKQEKVDTWKKKKIKQKKFNFCQGVPYISRMEKKDLF